MPPQHSTNQPAAQPTQGIFGPLQAPPVAARGGVTPRLEFFRSYFATAFQVEKIIAEAAEQLNMPYNPTNAHVIMQSTQLLMNGGLALQCPSGFPRYLVTPLGTVPLGDYRPAGSRRGSAREPPPILDVLLPALGLELRHLNLNWETLPVYSVTKIPSLGIEALPMADYVDQTLGAQSLFGAARHSKAPIPDDQVRVLWNTLRPLNRLAVR